MCLVGFVLIEAEMFSLNHSVRNSCVSYRPTHSADILLCPFFEHESVPSAMKHTDVDAQVFFVPVLLKSPSGWLCSYSHEGLLPDAAPQPACSLTKLRGKALGWHRMEELLLYSVPLADKRLIHPIVFSKKKAGAPNTDGTLRRKCQSSSGGGAESSLKQ